jgi:glyoxylase-like metal-dependent hydrolase (beta-lactamase superfamily II)
LVFQKVSDNVFAIVGLPAHANVAALVLPSAVVLVDCGIQLSAVSDARKEIEDISRRKVETVILTHFHSDHTGALPAFSDCRIISSNLLLKNLEQTGRKAPEGFKPTFPNETFDRQLELRDGNIKLAIKQTGGHTNCSTYVSCPNYRIVAVGDNLWTKYYPWGGARGSDPDTWIQTLKDYLFLDAEYFIPGHGPVGGKGSVTEMLNYLTNVRKVMKELTADGKSEKEAIRAGGEVEYCLSGGGHPHISTLKKWYKIWLTHLSR